MNEQTQIDERSLNAEVIERTVEKFSIIARHKAFLQWLDKALQMRRNGFEPPAPPHTLDVCEIRKATEMGLYGKPTEI